MEAASASANSLEAFITQSINRMDSQEVSLSNTGRAIQALVAQVSELTQQFQHLRVPTAPPTPPVPSTPPETLFQSEPRLPVPESYSGEPSFCRAFLTRCSMHFSLQPRTFNTEQTKVAFTLTLLTGRAALWGTAVWENQDPCCASFQALSDEMKRVFDRAAREGGGQNTRRPSSGWEIGLRLLHRVPDLSGRVSLERGGAVGHVSAWAGWPRPEGDLRPGPPYYTQWTHWSGTKGWCTTG